MRLDNSILEKLNDKIEALDVNNVTMYSIITQENKSKVNLGTQRQTQKNWLALS